MKHVPKGVKVLPMKMVLTLKPVPGMKTKKKKARACVRANFQGQKPIDLLYTANIDVITIRIILAIAAKYAHWGARVLDVVTAFLRAYMPQCDERDAVYVNLLEQFKL